MKVILEASSLLHPKTGIGRYTWELAQMLDAKDNISIQFYVQGNFYNSLEKIIQLKPRTSYPLWSKPLRIARRMYYDMRSKNMCENSLVHGPNYFLPACADSGIITVHDLSIYRYPETHPLERIKQFEKNFEDTLRRTEHIIADSVSTKREIIDVLGWSEDKISVVGLGVAPEFKPLVHENHAFLDKYGLHKDGYLLCVSTIEPRKNIDKLIQAYESLSLELKKAFPLVILGGEGWLSAPIMEHINKGVAQGWVIRPGYVSEVELVLFYQHARVFIYPSEYEGFGLPVAEAMASGIPVVISNRTSLPEVAQGCGLVVEPHDIIGFSQVIAKALCDTQWRERASMDGIAVALGYTWNKCVEETVKIYSLYKQ